MPPKRRSLGARALSLSPALASAVLAACGGSGGEPAAPRLPPGIHVVVGTALADTVDAAPRQAIVVEVRDQQGAVAPGDVVRFETRPVSASAADGVGAYVMALQGAQFATVVPQTTDGRGRASVLVRLGRHAGPTYVVATVPELGMADSVAVTVLPGAPARLAVAPLDTVLSVGASFTPRASSADRYGNSVAQAPLTLGGAAPELAISGTSVRAAKVGRAALTATVAGAQTTIWVSVVPQGTLAASTAAGLVMFQLDGSGRRTLTADPAGMTAWAPTGSAIAYDLAPRFGYGTPVEVADLSGHRRPVSAALGASVVQLSPAYSRADDWVYFSALAPGGPEVFRLYRVHADGTGTEPVANLSAEDDFFPSVSPDGSRLVYVRRTGGAMDYLRVLDVASGQVSRIDVPGHSPAWSPVTKDEIAYVDMRAGWVLKVMRPDGTGIRQVSAPGVTYERGLSWAPDGRWLAARNTTSGRLDLIEVATGLTIPLPFTSGMGFPAWKP